ncbi:hypothetical protein TNIN_250481 [Trichonephila inaurata madagascariensis]|uniref:Uncharacterized protein n=1 Tax=Trichonephila inaurata madagascariensis TaxID=2747483 RepID=A0A8X6WTW9_9ARAC|nr:hypothetical protein TNIN_250481 [Trichonephila inaurata madagascariensis]
MWSFRLQMRLPYESKSRFLQGQPQNIYVHSSVICEWLYGNQYELPELIKFISVKSIGFQEIDTELVHKEKSLSRVVDILPPLTVLHEA